MQPPKPLESPVQPLDPVTVPIIVAEYTALREEILQRMRSEAQLEALALIALGTLLAAGVQFRSAPLILVYPVVATALAIAYAAEDRGIQLLGAYIARTLEEERVGTHTLNWEHFIGNVRGFKTWFRNGVRLLFVGTEILALFLAISISVDIKRTLDSVLSLTFSAQDVTFDGTILLLGAACTLVTLMVLHTDDKKLTQPASSLQKS
jgi:hypothetical protein